MATLLGGVLLSAPSVFGQPTPAITEADMARAAQAQPAVTEADIERAKRRNPTPTDAELARVPIPSTPKVDVLPKPASRGSMDLEAIARGYESIVRDGVPKPDGQSGPALLVFISFSVPEATLNRLVDQAARAGAVLVIRGFVDGSLKATVARVQQLIGSRQVKFQIDPQAFDRFGVTQAPTFVLLGRGAAPMPCKAGSCFASASFVSVSGDVSLDYALDLFKTRAPRFANDAAPFLKRLRS